MPLRRSVWGSIRRKNVKKPFAAPAMPRTITMTAFDEEGRPPPPELDRDWDFEACANPSQIPIDQYYAFETLLPKQDVNNNIDTFFGLPAKVKHLIYGYCFPGEERTITLSPRFATKAIFDDDYFASPWEILAPVWGALSASSALRKEVMAHFWTEFTFHVSINPFSGPKLSPLSNAWLPEYLSIIQHLTIEVDFTRFGGSALRYAPSFGHDYAKSEKLLVGIVKGLKNRSVTMSQLIVLSRRYHGSRPVDGTYVRSDEVPWHPDVPLCDSFCELRGLLQRFRIAGFSLEYSKKMLHSLFPDEEQASIRIPKDSAWPPLPIYEPPVRAPSSLNAYSVLPISDVESNIGSSRRSTNGSSPHGEWELTLPRSQSFTEMFEQELYSQNQSQESLSSNYTISSVLSNDNEEDMNEAFPSLDENGQTLADHCRRYQALLPPRNYFENSPLPSNATTPRIMQSNNSPNTILTEHLRQLQTLASGNDPTLTRSAEGPPAQNLEGINSKIRLSSESVDPPTPTPTRRGLPPTMSIMNALNEQDPAFIRTIEAMQARESTPSRIEIERSQSTVPERPSMADSGNRCISSLSSRSVGGTRKSFKSFFSRLRGRSGA